MWFTPRSPFRFQFFPVSSALRLCSTLCKEMCSPLPNLVSCKTGAVRLNNWKEQRKFFRLTVWPQFVQSWYMFVSVALMELSHSGFITRQSWLLFRPLLSVEEIKCWLMFSVSFSGWWDKGRSGTFPWRNRFCQRRVVWRRIGWALRKEWRGSGRHKVWKPLDL